MLQGDNQKLMHDADLATQECVLRGKALNLANVRAVSGLMLVVSVLSTGVWIFEILALVYGNPIASDSEQQNFDGFEKKGNNEFFTLALAYGTCFFVLFQLIGLVVLICIPRSEMAKKDLDLLYINPNTPKNLKITIYLCAYLCELLSLLAQTEARERRARFLQTESTFRRNT